MYSLRKANRTRRRRKPSMAAPTGPLPTMKPAPEGTTEQMTMPLVTAQHSGGDTRKPDPTGATGSER